MEGFVCFYVHDFQDNFFSHQLIHDGGILGTTILYCLQKNGDNSMLVTTKVGFISSKYYRI